MHVCGSHICLVPMEVSQEARFPGSVSHHMGPANWTQVLCLSGKCSSLLSCLSRPHIKVPNIKVGIFLSLAEDSWRFSNSSDSNWEFYHSYLPPSTQSMLQISRLSPIRTPAWNSGPLYFWPWSYLLTMGSNDPLPVFKNLLEWIRNSGRHFAYNFWFI